MPKTLFASLIQAAGSTEIDHLGEVGDRRAVAGDQPGAELGHGETDQPGDPAGDPPQPDRAALLHPTILLGAGKGHKAGRAVGWSAPCAG